MFISGGCFAWNLQQKGVQYSYNATFAVLNLFIGIIVDAMQQLGNDGDTDDKLTEKELHQKIFNIEKQLKVITKTLENKK